METPYCLTIGAKMSSRMNRLTRSRSGYSLVVEIRASLIHRGDGGPFQVEDVAHGMGNRSKVFSLWVDGIRASSMLRVYPFRKDCSLDTVPSSLARNEIPI